MNTQILNSRTDPEYAFVAASLLQKGETAVIPTETVYGLAADALNEQAVKKIYEAKGRPSDNPLIVHIAEFSELEPLVKAVPEKAKQLADAFWPGPLTIILPKSELVPNRTSGGLPTVAVRMPSHPAARAVIKACGLPLAAPSANISGFPSPTKVEHVIDDMTGRVPLIVDGGDCSVGVESTVITFATEVPTILRPGGITPEMIEAVIGTVQVDNAVLNPLEQGADAASPGMKYKHYSPKTQVFVYCGTEKGYLRYLQANQKQGMFALCYEETAEKSPVPVVSMGKKSEPLSQTRRLFDALRELDEQGAAIAVAQCPEKSGIGLAVCNRLFRAAAFRFIREAPVVGLTGQTGAGKSTAAEVFAQAGYRIVDCDRIARSITEKGSPVLDSLCSVFGNDILEPDGSLNRKLLADRAFASPEQTERLNAITHPAILKKTKEEVLSYSAQNIPSVMDAPLLFQCPELCDLCDVTIAVTAPESDRLLRIRKRDGISEESAKKRMAAQPDERYYAEKADIILENASCSHLKENVEAAARRIMADAES